MAVHVLAVLAYKQGDHVTSSLLASSVNTNPVVIRRLLLTLQRAKLVETRKGFGQGSRLTRSPAKIGLDEVFRAAEATGDRYVPEPAFNYQGAFNIYLPIFFQGGLRVEIEALESVARHGQFDDPRAAVRGGNRFTIRRLREERGTANLSQLDVAFGIDVAGWVDSACRARRPFLVRRQPALHLRVDTLEARRGSRRHRRPQEVPRAPPAQRAAAHHERTAWFPADAELELAG